MTVIVFENKLELWPALTDQPKAKFQNNHWLIQWSHKNNGTKHRRIEFDHDLNSFIPVMNESKVDSCLVVVNTPAIDDLDQVTLFLTKVKERDPLVEGYQHEKLSRDLVSEITRMLGVCILFSHRGYLKNDGLVKFDPHWEMIRQMVTDKPITLYEILHDINKDLAKIQWSVPEPKSDSHTWSVFRKSVSAAVSNIKCLSEKIDELPLLFQPLEGIDYQPLTAILKRITTKAEGLKNGVDTADFMLTIEEWSEFIKKFKS